MNNLKNFLIGVIAILFLIINQNRAMEPVHDVKSQLDRFFEQWQGKEYHAKKFIADSKHSAKHIIHYYNDGIKIATFNNQKKIVTTYLKNGGSFQTSYKNFKKFMSMKIQ